MRSTKRAILLVVCAILLVVASVFGTMAYLTDYAEVKNTFTIGNVGLKLDETVVDLYGVADNPAVRAEKGNQYKLISGHTYTKDPMVTVDADSEESYIRMIVKISDIADVKAAFGTDATTGYFLPQYFVQGWDPAVWVSTNVVDETTIPGTAIYEFRYFETVSTDDAGAKELAPLFTSFKVPEEVENDALGKLADMEITVEAHAIQADGFADAAAAWVEFSK